MKHLLKGIVPVLVLLGVVAWAYAIHEIIPSETFVPMPGANAEKLNEYIIRYQPYRSWKLWPGKGRLYEGTEPHGSLLTTFVNDIAYRSIRKKAGMREGSIIAKENYTADKEFIALTVMYKIEGYNPEAGDWFWARYAPDGKVEASGKVGACIKCHSRRKDNDYIYTGAVVGK
jgi:hypothetical protein